MGVGGVANGEAAAAVDHVACILPFEQEYFRRHGVKATFVGHPLFDALPLDREAAPRAERFPARPPVVGLLPGSRKSEAEQNFPRLLEVAEMIRQEFPATTFLVPTTSATHPIVERLVSPMIAEGAGSSGGWSIEFGQDRFDAFVLRCDLLP